MNKRLGMSVLKTENRDIESVMSMFVGRGAFLEMESDIKFNIIMTESPLRSSL